MANKLRIHLANATPRRNGSATANVGGHLAAGTYQFAIVAWYNDGDESKLLNAGFEKWYYTAGGVYTLYSSPVYTTVVLSGSQSVTLNWYAPLRNWSFDDLTGLVAPEVHHYAVYYRTGSDGDNASTWTKCAVTGYADGNIPPTLLTATVDSVTSLVTETTAPVTRYDTDRDAFWIKGDHRISFNGDATDYTRFSISGSNNNDGAKACAWCDLAFTQDGVQTLVGLDGSIATESTVTGSLVYDQGPVTFHQPASAGTGYDFWHSWGTHEYIELDPVIDMRLNSRELYYRGWEGMVSPADFGVEVDAESLNIIVNATSLTGWQWAYLRHWRKSKAQLWIVDFNDEGSLGTGEQYGYSTPSQWYGRLSGISQLGNVGKNNSALFQFDFLVESEV